jgi:hypothetical protein
MHHPRQRLMLAALSRLPVSLSRWLSIQRHGALYIIALGLLLASPALWTEPVADDLLHELLLRETPGIRGLQPRQLDLFRFASGEPSSTRALMNEGVFPWWTDPGVKLAFFRPLAGLTHWIDWHWASGKAWLMHLQSLGWYAALLGALALTYRRFAPGATAMLALLLYAVDDAHASTIGWVANRNAVIAVCFSVLALSGHDAWRRSRSRSLAALGPVFLGLALLAGEAGVAGAAYLLSYALFLERGSFRERALTLIGPVLVLLAWRVLYVWLGYGTSGSGVYVDPGSSPLAFARILLERVPVLLLATVALPWADFWEVYGLLSPWAAPLVWCLALAVLVGLGFVLRPLFRQSATARFWAAGTVLSVVPAAATFPHDRMLLAVTVGWMALLGELLTSSVRSKGALHDVAVSGLVVVHVIAAPLLFPIRASNLDQLNRWLSRSTAEFPPPGELSQSTIVLLNPPLDPLAAYLPLYFESKHSVRPRRFLWLASGGSAVQVRRLDPQTLSIRPERGYLDHATQLMLRSPAHPLPLGHTVRLEAATLEVTALTSDGRPAEVSVRFEQPLDDPALLLMRWKHDRYVRFAPPRANELAELPPVDFIRLFSG